MPTVPDPDLVPFDPPDHPTIRAAFRNIIESYPRALYDEQGLVRYRTRFLDSVLVSGPELIHDILVARAHLFRRDDVARQLLTPMLGPTSLFMAEGADWKWQRRAVAPTFRHDKLLALVPTFSAIAVRQAERWRAAPRERPVDVAEAMAQTTCEAIVDTMLGSAGALDVQGFARALTTELESFPWRFILTPFRAPSWLPYPGRPRAARAREHIYREAARLVAQRRRGTAACSDLLDLLLQGRDEKTGRMMTDEELVRPTVRRGTAHLHRRELRDDRGDCRSGNFGSRLSFQCGHRASAAPGRTCHAAAARRHAPLTSCRGEGPFEQAGRTVDQGRAGQQCSDYKGKYAHPTDHHGRQDNQKDAGKRREA